MGWERSDGITIVSDPLVSGRLVVFLEGGAGGRAEETDSIADERSARGQPPTSEVFWEGTYLNVTIMTALPASMLFWTKAPPS